MKSPAKDVKKIAYGSGADLCGISSAQSFSEAPEGFHPCDIWSETASVLVFAVRVPGSSEKAESRVPYTLVNGMMAGVVDRMSLDISAKLDLLGIGNVIIPSDDPYETWNPNISRGEAILSLRHAGYLAGLGKLGKNGLLINRDLGSMIQIGAILLDRVLDTDPLADYRVCPPDCYICIESCPVSALGGESTDQALCRPLSVCRNEKGFVIKQCWNCRSLCPSCRGTARWESAGGKEE